MHEKTKSKLEQVSLMKKIEEDAYGLNVKTEEEFLKLCVRRSIFAVELYSLLFSDVCSVLPTSLYVGQDQTILDPHIANCIVSGDALDTSVALDIVGLLR